MRVDLIPEMPICTDFISYHYTFQVEKRVPKPIILGTMETDDTHILIRQLEARWYNFVQPSGLTLLLRIMIIAKHGAGGYYTRMQLYFHYR